MKKFFTQGRLVTLVVAGVLIIDQLIKIAVKTNMYLHENIHVTDWFYIYFTENNGMAFGLEIFAKLFLTLFRIVAAILITVYLVKLVKRTDKVKNGYLVCLSLILAGAVGNIIDCVFYGEILVRIRRLLRGFHWDRDIPTGCMARWSICSTSRLSIPTGLTGCLL